ncbi:MAG: filamentous hemagglutinin N-terminal domain-containing protein, partial [Leptolyngbyaceae bacterium]|nr:filamentous hemagglutinin N-terminal domain-containing protein [Leptolyngbyaceae bacterium]
MVFGYFLEVEPTSAQIPQIQEDGTTSTRVFQPTEASEPYTVLGESVSGDNLFHSFERFSIPENVSVRFNASGAENIFVRVTGNRHSRISGRLSVDNSANFFLLNPNGIVFRDGAQLDIGGTFVATTADAIAFGDRGEFSAIDPEVNTSLLTVQPSALRFLRGEQQTIRNQADLDFTNPDLMRSTNPSLVFVGGAIRFSEINAETAEGNVIIPRGRLQLAAVGGIGDVEYDANTHTITVPDGMRRGRTVFGDVVIDVGTGQLSIDAEYIRGRSTRFQASRMSDRPTSIRLRASDRILLTNTSQINFSSGDISLEANRTIHLNNRSTINGSAAQNSSGGSIRIRSENLTVSNASSINARTFSRGDAGEIFLDVDETIQIVNNSQINSLAATLTNIELGNGGNISIQTSLLELDDDAEISTVVVGENGGRGGTVFIDADAVSLNDRSFIEASVDSSQPGGNITLTDTDFLLLRNNSRLSARALTTSDGGNLTIDADLIVALPEQNNDLLASALEGRGGNIEITTRGLFGLDVREAVEGNITNDIDASSRFGVDGVVSINRLEVDPSQSLEDLPDEVVNVATLIDENACQSLGISEF